MYRGSKFLVLLTIALYYPSVLAENDPRPSDYHEFVFSVKDRQRNFTGTLISNKFVVSVPNLSSNTVICPLYNSTNCTKPTSMHEVSGELTFMELKRVKSEPELFTGNVSKADCVEVRAGIEARGVVVGGPNHFVDCLGRECGYLEPIICDGKLAGLVAKLENYNTNLFVPVEYLRKEINKYN